MNFYYLFSFITIFFSSFSVNAQGFNTRIIGGINAAQLEGDQLSGFDKAGLHLGIGIEYPLLKNSLSMELLFNQKGSAEKPNSQLPDRVKTTLNYAQIPIFYHFNSWYNEVGYYRIGVQVGPYISRLISANSNVYDTSSESFKSMDYGLILGVRYRMRDHLAATIMYDQSLSEAYNIPFSDESGLVSYLVTLRLEYHL